MIIVGYDDLILRCSPYKPFVIATILGAGDALQGLRSILACNSSIIFAQTFPLAASVSLSHAAAEESQSCIFDLVSAAPLSQLFSEQWMDLDSSTASHPHDSHISPSSFTPELSPDVQPESGETSDAPASPLPLNWTHRSTMPNSNMFDKHAENLPSYDLYSVDKSSQIRNEID